MSLGALGPSVSRMIGFHHKLTPYRAEDAHLVEPFRREAQSAYPICGFRGFVCRTVLIGALKQPWRPLPMLRWQLTAA